MGRSYILAFPSFGLLDILIFWPARYSNLKDYSIFNFFRVARYSKVSVTRYSSFSGRSKFRVSWLLHMFTCRAARSSKFSFCSIFKVVGLLDNLTFLGCSIFKLFGLLDIQYFRAARYLSFSYARCSKLLGCSIFKLFGFSIIKLFGPLDI